MLVSQFQNEMDVPACPSNLSLSIAPLLIVPSTLITTFALLLTELSMHIEGFVWKWCKNIHTGCRGVLGGLKIGLID